jgi:hypothetical protein
MPDAPRRPVPSGGDQAESKRHAPALSKGNGGISILSVIARVAGACPSGLYPDQQVYQAPFGPFRWPCGGPHPVRGWPCARPPRLRDRSRALRALALDRPFGSAHGSIFSTKDEPERATFRDRRSSRWMTTYSSTLPLLSIPEWFHPRLPGGAKSDDQKGPNESIKLNADHGEYGKNEFGHDSTLVTR